MPGSNPIRAFFDLPNEHPVKTLGMALLVALTCSLLVSVTAVTLRPLQEANRLREGNVHLAALMQRLGMAFPERRLVTLKTGAYADSDPGTVTEMSSRRDLAGLNSREDVATVYELREGDQLRLVVLPVRGAGYESMLKGYLALRDDLNTVAALTFYEHGETPGLGAKIMEAGWQAQWDGKQVSDQNGFFKLKVVKGGAEGPHEVDGISGATRTSDGVSKLVKFWLGNDGYGPYLKRLQAEADQ